MQVAARGGLRGLAIQRTDEGEHAGTDLSDTVTKVEQTDRETAEDDPVSR